MTCNIDADKRVNTRALLGSKRYPRGYVCIFKIFLKGIGILLTKKGFKRFKVYASPRSWKILLRKKSLKDLVSMSRLKSWNSIDERVIKGFVSISHPKSWNPIEKRVFKRFGLYSLPWVLKSYWTLRISKDLGCMPCLRSCNPIANFF